MSMRKIGAVLRSLSLASLLVVIFSVVAASSTISVSSGLIAGLGSTITVAITLDKAPNGLAGYTITVSLSNPSLADIIDVAFPGWASPTNADDIALLPLPAASVEMRAVDLGEAVEAGATAIALGTVTIEGTLEGECEINVVVDRADDDGGYPIAPSVSPGTLKVQGVTAAVFRVDSEGNVLADQAFYGASFQTGAADVAEWVSVSGPVEPGDVLELDPDNPQHYRKTTGSCSSLVAGVVSTQPGVTLGSSPLGFGPRTDDSRLATEDSALLALLGIVPVKACDEGGAIGIGDLLVVASIPGYAKKWNAEYGGACPLIGKALEEMDEQTGTILVLLMR